MSAAYVLPQISDCRKEMLFDLEEFGVCRIAEIKFPKFPVELLIEREGTPFALASLTILPFAAGKETNLLIPTALCLSTLRCAASLQTLNKKPYQALLFFRMSNADYCVNLAKSPLDPLKADPEVIAMHITSLTKLNYEARGITRNLKMYSSWSYNASKDEKGSSIYHCQFGGGQ